jgi:hypothetical protein
MKNKFSIVLSIALLFIVQVACQQDANQTASQSAQNIAPTDSAASCSQATIMDPNQAKPMALMMRQMVINADSMKQRILRNETLDSLQFRFIKFYLVEPTDPNVLEPNFFEKSRLHQAAYMEMFKHPKEQVKYYNLMIASCVSCHKDYCSGPLKRINKLPIDL